MSAETQSPPEKIHRFLDEAGDTTFFGKGRVPLLGQSGVSLSFGLGMVKFAAPVAEYQTAQAAVAEVREKLRKELATALTR